MQVLRIRDIVQRKRKVRPTDQASAERSWIMGLVVAIVIVDKRLWVRCMGDLKDED
jgi:hypothetical protein